jgi:hypothetical protein
LPVVGQGAFYLVMRSYDPDPRIATAEWAPPPMKTDP